jgi:hypothetical protein
LKTAPDCRIYGGERLIGFADFMAARTNPKGAERKSRFWRRTVPALGWRNGSPDEMGSLLQYARLSCIGPIAAANWKVTG